MTVSALVPGCRFFPQLGLIVSDFFRERNAQFFASRLDLLDHVWPDGVNVRRAFALDSLKNPDGQTQVVYPTTR